MYGQIKYGDSRYGDNTTKRAKEEYYEDLTRLVPPFLPELTEMGEIYRTEGVETGYARYVLEDSMKQLFLATATWGLPYWEKILGIEENRLLTYEQRREILMAKLNGQGTVTEKMLKESVEAFCGGEVAVVEKNQEYHFIIRFLGIKGIPPNMKGLMEMIEEIKPAHLAYEFEYRYTIWKEMKSYMWNELEKVSWNDIKSLMEG